MAPRVIVVGAGIAGAAVARELTHGGASVLLIEGGDAPGAHGATAAGMGHVGHFDGDDAQLQLCRLAVRLWEEASQLLPRSEGLDRMGTLWVAEDEASMKSAQEKGERLASAGIEVEMIDAQQLSSLEPALASDMLGGLLLPEDGVLYAPVAAAALTADACKHGAELRLGSPVESVQSRRVVLASGETLVGDAVVVASGLHALELLDAPPIGVEILPRKGHLAITARGSPLVHHQVIELAYHDRAHAGAPESISFNVLPRPTGQILIGSSRTPGAGDGQIDELTLEKMLARARRFLPALGRLPILRCWTGVRPATSDGRPLIGAHPHLEGVWISGGFEGLGITLAPAAARLIADDILGRTPLLDSSPWSPTRRAAS